MPIATLEEQVESLQKQVATIQLQLNAVGKRVIALEDEQKLAQLNRNNPYANPPS